MLALRTTGPLALPLVPLVRARHLFRGARADFSRRRDLCAHLAAGVLSKTENNGPKKASKRSVEQAEEEGIHRARAADLIEQVVEFTTKRVREVNDTAPGHVAMAADATLEEFACKIPSRMRFARMPV